MRELIQLSLLRTKTAFLITFLVTGYGFDGLVLESLAQDGTLSDKTALHAVHDKDAGTISIIRANNKDTIITQHAQEKIRPFLHPIVAPDGKGILTEYRPGHHTHQTGLYWGFKELNGRDYFMDCCKPGQDNFHRRVSANIIEEKGEQVKWQTVYNLLDEDGNTTLVETHNWSMQEQDGKYLIDVEWKGEAKTDITFGHFYVGGLFLRMQWHEGIPGEMINASGHRNQEAEGKRSIWTDVGIQVDGRDNLAHIAIFDHPDNKDFPSPWRVDNELGIGPSRQILGDWKLDKGEKDEIRYRLIVYTGEIAVNELNRSWIQFATE